MRRETCSVWNIHTDQACCLCSQAAEYEGIKIFHSNSSVYFANSDLYVNSLKEKVAVCLSVWKQTETLLWGKYVKHLLSLGLTWLSLRGAAWACNHLVVDASTALLWDEQEVSLLVFSLSWLQMKVCSCSLFTLQLKLQQFSENVSTFVISAFLCVQITKSKEYILTLLCELKVYPVSKHRVGNIPSLSQS